MPCLLLAAACDGESAGSSESGVTAGAVFQETTAAALREQGCGPGSTRGCYTNYAVVADIDGDGNLDIAMANGGDHFFPTAPEPQALFFGDGRGNFADGASALTGLTPSIVRQLAIADFDGDGRLDIFLPAGYGTTDDQLFFQTGARHFTSDPNRLPGSAAGERRSRAGATHAGDIDGDGDIDLVIADWGAQPNNHAPGVTPVRVHVLENDGHGRFRARATLDAPDGTAATDIDLQDVNGDFALDIVLTNRNGQSRLYFNDGRGNFTDVTRTKAFPPKQGPFTFNAELCDIDGDGDLDLFFDGGASHLADHATQVLINDGSGRFSDETALRIPREPRTDDNQVKCVDYDSDGDFDLVVASLTNGTEKLFRNVDGRGHFEYVEGAFPVLRDPTLAIDLGDFDGDGKPDLMTAQGEVRNAPWLDRIFKNVSPNGDRNKPIFRAVEHPRAAAGAPIVVRFAVSDAHTSETGQAVKAVSLTAFGRELPATFIGGDLYRAVIPPQPSGTSFEVAPHAIDRSGNEARGPAVAIAIP